jgi:hypothetical protein
MSILHTTKIIINNNRILERIYYRLKSIIRIIPYYLVLEGDSAVEKESEIKPKMDSNRLVVSLLSESDMKELSQSPETNLSEKKIVDRLKGGWYCMGIRYDGCIISYLWYSLKQGEDFLPLRLNKNEAYITDVRTFEAFREKNLAPYLRCELYKYLRKIGRNKFYSITFCYNKPAIRVMEKIFAKPIKLYLSIIIAKKFYWNIVLKTFT